MAHSGNEDEGDMDSAYKPRYGSQSASRRKDISPISVRLSNTSSQGTLQKTLLVHLLLLAVQHAGLHAHAVDERVVTVPSWEN